MVFTGRHMAWIMIAFFGVVVAVNLLMARLAGSTFGGVVVENSYVASQKFNGWLDKAEADRALGWKADVRRAADGRVSVAIAGVPAFAGVTAAARHPLGRMPDTRLTFVQQADGRFLSREVLPAGRWQLRLVVTAGERAMRTEAFLN